MTYTVVFLKLYAHYCCQDVVGCGLFATCVYKVFGGYEYQMASGSRKHLRGGVGEEMTAANIDYTIEFSLSPQMNKLVSEFAVFQFF